jgi:hypothetical protein
MQKLLLLSILLATFAIPARASGDAQPRRGLRRAVYGFLLFAAFYAVGLLYIYPRLA